jgi:hypothetical protein
VLLGGGAAGAVLFVVVFLINDQVRANYDPVRDFVSEAAIGSGGWVQIVNFLVSGSLIVASSFGLGSAASRWTGRLIALIGAGLIGAGVFVADPSPADTTTWHGGLHAGFSVVVFGSLIAACFTAARSQPGGPWRWCCRVTGIAVTVLLVSSGALTDVGGALQRITIAVGWSWLAVLCLRAMHGGGSADPPLAEPYELSQR